MKNAKNYIGMRINSTALSGSALWNIVPNLNYPYYTTSHVFPNNIFLNL
jgi:hypothetical protein